MNKKKLTKIIVSIIGSVILAAILILIGLGFKNISLDQLALDYNMITGNYSATLIQPGIHYIGVSNEFLKVKTSPQALNFLNLKSMSSDFIDVTLSVQVTYKLSYIDATNITNYIKSFGLNPESYLTPIMRNEIHRVISRYDLSTLSPFNISLFEDRLETSIKNTLASMIAMEVNVTLQAITANYQISENSGYIAELKQEISRYRNDLANLGDTVPSDYAYMIQQLGETTKTSLGSLNTLEMARLDMALTWINQTFVDDKFRNYVKSADQEFYQWAIAPGFIKNGSFT